MGSGIAESVARAGVDVLLYEPERPALERARARIAASVARAVARGKLTGDEAVALEGRIRATTVLGDVVAPVVVEAIVEDPQAKGRVFQELDALLPPTRCSRRTRRRSRSRSSRRGRAGPSACSACTSSRPCR